MINATSWLLFPKHSGKRNTIFSLLVAAMVPQLMLWPDAQRPNIVLILTDDQGYGDLGITGNPVLETPNIDRLARQSVWVERFYVSPVCSPTRASLLTGRYNYRTRVIDTYKGRSMMDPSELTIAEVLRDAGYATGIFGKWHLGNEYPMRPIDQGFEESLVLRGGGLAQPAEPIENRGRYTDPILFHNDRPISTHGFCTDVFFETALRFMARSAKSGRPFFAYIAPNAPHGPFHDVPERLYRKYRNRDLSPVLLGNRRDADKVARIFAMIENIDENVGRLLRFLDEHGLAENTIVIFMVDNGPNTARYVGLFRGMKGQVYEGGIRSPFFIRWPARLKAGTRITQMAAHIDVMPTLIEAAGASVPKGLKLDGRSLLPLLQGKKTEWPERTIIIQAHRGDRPVPLHNVATCTDRWKLVHPTGFGRETLPAEVPFELYDVITDPEEKHNLAPERPEIVSRLVSAYMAWFKDVSSTRPNNYAPPRIVIGSDRDPTTMLTWQDWRVSDPQGWGRRGMWLLYAERDAAYDIILRWREPIPPATIRLCAGDTTVQKQTDRPLDRIEFNDVLIRKGALNLRVEVITDTGRLDPYHVILMRRQARAEKPLTEPDR